MPLLSQKLKTSGCVNFDRIWHNTLIYYMGLFSHIVSYLYWGSKCVNPNTPLFEEICVTQWARCSAPFHNQPWRRPSASLAARAKWKAGRQRWRPRRAEPAFGRRRFLPLWSWSQSRLPAGAPRWSPERRRCRSWPGNDWLLFLHGGTAESRE